MTTEFKPGDTVTGKYFGYAFSGTVQQRSGGIIMGPCYTIIRCQPALCLDWDEGLIFGKSIRTEIGLYDYQLDRPALDCSLELVAHHA